MKIIKSLFILLVFNIFLNGCNTLGEAGKVLRNEKAKGTDEFLIKKKEPLTQPPNFETILKPGTEENKTKKRKDGIEKLLKDTKSESVITRNKKSSTEDSILNQIKK
jgi:hypothetical protein|tara:strand:+ start:564 stop:884 length:321 start_codon:yes stop_codon:yes gene_type:complete